MDVGTQVLFQPNAASMAREIGEITVMNGDNVTIRWNKKDYSRDRKVDFLRESLK